MTEFIDNGPPPPPPSRKRKLRGRPKRRYRDGREVFKTRLHPAIVEELREIGQGWANRGIEYLVRRYGTEAKGFHDRVT